MIGIDRRWHTPPTWAAAHDNRAGGSELSYVPTLSPDKSAIVEQLFSVSFDFPVYFTRHLFGSGNRVLVDAGSQIGAIGCCSFSTGPWSSKRRRCRPSSRITCPGIRRRSSSPVRQ